MPIQRPSEREQRPSALDVFTDREELIAAFERNLEQKKPEEHRVLVFYGDGGIGKTTLLQKLEQLHRRRCPQALMGRLDLAGADTTPPDLLLFRLRRLFPAIPFPCFSLALAEYGRRFHPEQVYGNDRNELLQGAGPYAEVLAEGLDALKILKGVGLAVAGMKALAKGHQQVSVWVQRRAEPLLQRSQSCSEDQLLAQLPLHWARDFRQAISSHLGQDWDDVTTSSQDWDDAITYSGAPPLIALDTYETLWHTGMGSSGRRREPRERWLVDLVSELPEVLWVIGGRDRLSWEEGYDRGWSEACEQHLVGQLSDDDARSFLSKRGIVEPAIVAKILSQAAGVPFYLELQSQLYDKTPAEERTPEVFGGSHQEQIDRLLTHLDASERATLKLMAAFGIWDQELFRQAVTHFATGYPATGAAELGRFWSIEPVGEGRWQLHNEMAHHLQADERQRDPATFEAVHRWGFAYFDGPLEGLEVKAIQAEDAERLQRALRHARCLQPAAEWVPWLVSRLDQLKRGAIWQPLLALAERGVRGAETELGGNDPAVAELLNRQGEILYAIARYEDAEPLFRKALSIDEARYGPKHPNRATTLNNLAMLLLQTNRLSEAEPLCRLVLEIIGSSFGQGDPTMASGLNNLAMLLRDSNRLDEAEPLMRNALAIDESSHGADHPYVANRLNNLALILQDRGRLAEAEPLFRRAVSIYQASYGSEHPELGITLNNLALLLCQLERDEEAETLFLQALAITKAVYGPDHPEVSSVLNNFALWLKANNRHAEAEPYYRQALAIDEAVYGRNDPRVACRLNNLSQLLQDTHRALEAEVLLQRVLEILEFNYGKEHPHIAISLNNLAMLLKETNRLAEAEALMQRALSVAEASYPKNHPDLATALCNLAQLLQEASRMAESEQLLGRALVILHNSLGRDHPRTQQTTSRYRTHLQAQGLAESEIQVKLNSLLPLN